MIKRALLLALPAALLFPAIAAAQTSLKCPDLDARYRSLKVTRLQPLRRGKRWRPGKAKTINTVSCDMHGLKTGEAEYDGKNLVLKRSYVYKTTEETKEYCKKRKSEEKLTTSFSDEAQSSLDDFCRRNKRKDFSMVQVFDASPSKGRATARKPLRRIFRIYNKKGFVAEEHYFDPFMNLESVNVYSYDRKNNLTQLSVNDFDGRQMKRETYTGNKATRSRTASLYGGTNQLRRKTVKELREDNTVRREVRTDYDSGEQPVTRVEITYDTRGVAKKEQVFDADAAEPRYEYDYFHKVDAKGNWTERWRTRVTIFNGKRLKSSTQPPEITTRTISYY